VDAHPVRIAFLVAGTAFKPRVRVAGERAQISTRTRPGEAAKLT
jgi:hypothetical protein